MADHTCLHYRELEQTDSFAYGTKFDVDDALGATTQSISVIEFAPGEAGPLSYHDDPVEELYVVLEGTLEIELDGETFQADAGSTALITPGVEHRPRNTSDEPAVLLVVQAPPAEATTYVEE